MDSRFTTLAGWVAAGLIMAAALFLMTSVSVQESGTMDELAHIPAGYGYVSQLDYRLNPEHPPLVKALAAFPLLFLNPAFPTDAPAWADDVNGQWEMGRELLYRNGNNADQIIQWARVGPMLLTLLLIAFVYFWAAGLMGRWWALVPTLMTGLSPNFLAHGHYVTTDIAAAFGAVIATYYFLRYLERPSRRSLILAGLAFGIAQACKFSAILLLPFFGVLLTVWYVVRIIQGPQPSVRRFRHWSALAVRRIGGFIAVLAIGFVVIIYPLYFLFTVHYPIERQVADTTFILHSFQGGPQIPGTNCNAGRCLAEVNIWAAGNPLLRPYAQYMLGILMVLQRSSGGNTNYFMDQVSAAGWTSYFPTVYALKEPLPILILVLTALVVALGTVLLRTVRHPRDTGRRLLNYLTTNFTEFAMLFFVVMYWAYSIHSPLNIGIRHLFPTLPFIYMLTAGFWKRWIANIAVPQSTGSLFAAFRAAASASARMLAKYIVFVLLILWFLTETAAAYPYYLSYFNELGGGPMSGYRYVTDSNYDWGQDLKRLQVFVQEHPEIDKIGVDYFGAGEPKYYLGDKEENWWSARGNPADQGIHWLAVSVNTLQGAIQPAAPGFDRKPEDEYRWLTDWRAPEPGIGGLPPPDYRIGTSIFVYKL